MTTMVLMVDEVVSYVNLIWANILCTAVLYFLKIENAL
jgi:hypothetical protein